ncbi:MAG: CotH kinase family protein, partial [Clostridia bacterium]|nr:CotH kinase family protein [Clostridia bacterium]
VLDISSVLKYTAVNAVIANEDSYIGERARNYYFYESDGKTKMIPWDFNLAFGTDTSLRKDNYAIKLSLIDADVKAPYFSVEASARPLVSNLLSQSVYYDEYMQYVNKLSEFMDELPDKCNSVKALIDENVKNDTTSFYGYDMFAGEFDEGRANSLMSFIKARSASIKTQLGK